MAQATHTWRAVPPQPISRPPPPAFNGSSDAFVAKLNPTGSALTYSTFLGGTGGDGGYGIAIQGGNAYVTGEAISSPDFPTTPGAYDRSFNGFDDAFVTEFNRKGTTLLYSTFLGGSDYDLGRAIAVDRTGSAYVTGIASTGFPTTPGAYDQSYNGGTYDGFATKLNPAGSQLIYSTFLGGSFQDDFMAIALDRIGDAYVVGATSSPDYPTTPNAFDRSYNENTDALVSEIGPTGSSLLYSTYLGGGQGDEANGVAIKGRNIYTVGTTSSANFPTTPNSYDPTPNGSDDAFIVKLKPS